MFFLLPSLLSGRKENNMRFYTVNKEYIEYLCKSDKQIMRDDKERPRIYVGLIHPVKWFNYLIPLSSAKAEKDYEILPDGTEFARSGYDRSVKYIEAFSKHNKLEVCSKLMMGKMIPVPSSEYHYVDINKSNDLYYRSLLIKEYEFIKKNQYKIRHFCENELYQSITKGIDYMNIEKEKCVDFNLAEKNCRKWEYDRKMQQDDYKELFDDLEQMGLSEDHINAVKKDIFYGYDLDDIRYKFDIGMYHNKTR